MLEIEKYVRRPFEIDAVRVTEDNIKEAAAWCGGDVRSDKNGAKYVKVRVVRPLTTRQSEAYVNDWILYAGTGYKVYTPKAFEDSFYKSSPDTSLTLGKDELVAVQEQELRTG